MTDTVTITEVHAVTYSLSTGKRLSTSKIKTLSKLKTLLEDLDIYSERVYQRALRLQQKGLSIAETLTAIIKQEQQRGNNND